MALATATGAALVHVSVPDQATASKIAEGLVLENLAACVQMSSSMQGVYVWEGKLEKTEELPLSIKTTGALVPALTAYVQQHHPYKECEVVSVAITGGSETYLQWVHDSVKQPG